MSRRLFVGVSVLFVVVAFDGISSAQTAQNLVDQVSVTQYTDYQWDIEQMGLGLYGGPAYNQGYRNRYNIDFESLGFKEANLYLTDQYNSMGTLSVNPGQSAWKNVVATLPGVDPDPAIRNKIYIVGGHYDHPQYSTSSGPGGDDNASGSAGVLEAARIMSQYQFRSTILFINWGGEEGWMLGSEDFMNNVVKKNYGSGADPNHLNVAGMLNLDMILAPFNADAPTAPLDLDIGTRVAFPQCVAWADKFRAAGARYAPSILIDATHGADYNEWYASDQGPFMNAENGFMYPGLMIAENTCHEIWDGSNPWYHTAGDASNMPAGARYDYNFATNVVKIAVGMIAEEAQLVPINLNWTGGNSSGPTNWGKLENWSPKGIPDGPGAEVSFGNQASENNVVDMTAAGRTVGSITFAGITSTAIESTGGFSLTMDNQGAPALIDVTGSHAISARVLMDDDLIITGSGTLNLTAGVSGRHTLTVKDGTVNATTINVDTLRIGFPAAAVPEPATVMLLGTGIVALGVFARKRGMFRRIR